jgi:hypothetical protein
LILRKGVTGKRALITVSLVDESADHPNEEIEKEIYSELSKEVNRIPWAKKIVKVIVEG